MGELIPYRKIGDLSIGALALGTMRFVDKQCTAKELAQLYTFLYYELGINLHHSCYEYNSYGLYAESLTYCKRHSHLTFHHICKLSSPDFKEEKFSARSLKDKVHYELKKLKIERIDVLQWLFRNEPINDELRLKKLYEQLHEINDCFDEFIKEGLVGYVGTFPYTVLFGKELSITIAQHTGWITYLNILEKEYIQNLPPNQWMIGLRPFAAGKIFSGTDQTYDRSFKENFHHEILSDKERIASAALRYCLQFDSVKSNVLSINSMEQAKSLRKVMNTVNSISEDQHIY